MELLDTAKNWYLKSKINVFRRIKSFKWELSAKINIFVIHKIALKLLDYCFIILQLDRTWKVKSDIQNMQNQVLRIIKYIPLKASIKTICKKMIFSNSLQNDKKNSNKCKKMYNFFLQFKISSVIKYQGQAEL